MHDDHPTGDVHPMILRDVLAATETQRASVGMRYQFALDRQRQSLTPDSLKTVADPYCTRQVTGEATSLVMPPSDEWQLSGHALLQHPLGPRLHRHCRRLRSRLGSNLSGISGACSGLSGISGSGHSPSSQDTSRHVERLHVAKRYRHSREQTFGSLLARCNRPTVVLFQTGVIDQLSK